MVAGLLLVARPYACGLLLGLGGLVKVFPALLLPAARGRGAWPRALAGAATVAGAHSPSCP